MTNSTTKKRIKMKEKPTECDANVWKKKAPYTCTCEPEFYCKTHEEVFCGAHVYTVSATNFDRRIVRNKQSLCHSGFKSEYENPLDGGCNLKKITNSQQTNALAGMAKPPKQSNLAGH